MSSTGTSIQPEACEHSRARLLNMIRAKDVQTVFQAIVDLRDGSITAFEALTRPGKDSGFLDPGAMFQDAARAGLLWPLEELTRESALLAATHLPQGVRLFFNCTPEVLADCRFTESFERIISGPHGVGRDRLVLEITELSGQENVDALAEQVERLKRLGLEVAIDDVGAGTSGLNRVMQLRPQWLKLDHEFIKGIDSDSFKQNLVRFFVHFSRLSCVNVVAEGIENKDELATIVSLGVRFGQGFFLARPASLSQITASDYARRVKEHWDEVEPVASQTPGSTPMRRLCLPATVTESTATIGTVAGILDRHPDISGIVVMDGRRHLGWCPRAGVTDEANHGRLNRPISELASSGVCAISPDATVQDALHLISVRNEIELTQPLVIADAGQVIGIVPVRDILEAAAGEGLSVSGARVPLTGLPNRVKADQHLTMLLEGAAHTLGEPGIGLGDAAFVDIRRFADYNATYGYDLGDRVIRELVDLMRTIVVQDEPGMFLAHLGDDRFLLTAPPGIIGQRLRAMMAEFDRCYGASPLSKDEPDSHPVAHALRTPIASHLNRVVPFVGLSLRVMHVPDVFTRIKSPRELYRIEQQLRQRSRREERLPHNVGKSIFLTDTRLTSARLLKKTA